jgi:hypothetical protein
VFEVFFLLLAACLTPVVVCLGAITGGFLAAVEFLLAGFLAFVFVSGRLA